MIGQPCSHINGQRLKSHSSTKKWNQSWPTRPLATWLNPPIPCFFIVKQKQSYYYELRQIYLENLRGCVICIIVRWPSGQITGTLIQSAQNNFYGLMITCIRYRASILVLKKIHNVVKKRKKKKWASYTLEHSKTFQVFATKNIL
jgi:hypothetical protein